MNNFQNKANIIKISKQLRGLARLGLILWAIGLALFLLSTATLLTHRGNFRADYISFGGISAMVLAFMVNLSIFRFFDSLRNGKLFDAKTIGYLETAGKWWLLYTVFDFVFGLVGNGWLGCKMTFTFGHLFASLTIIFFAWLFREAQELQEEQELTV